MSLDEEALTRAIAQAEAAQGKGSGEADAIKEAKSLLEALRGEACDFYFVRADAIRNGEITLRSSFLKLKDEHPECIERKRMTFKEALSGTFVDTVCTVSHRWETSEEPDTQNVQLDALSSFLTEDPRGKRIDWIWYDYLCMPQGATRTEEQKVEFKVMLRNINMLYLGVTVLILLDISYMSRFWTQFEAWLSFMQGSKVGLVSAPRHQRRGVIKPIHNATRKAAEQLVDMWADRDSKQAKVTLGAPDVTVTNESDKEEQLQKVLRFDARISELFEEDPTLEQSRAEASGNNERRSAKRSSVMVNEALAKLGLDTSGDIESKMHRLADAVVSSSYLTPVSEETLAEEADGRTSGSSVNVVKALSSRLTRAIFKPGEAAPSSGAQGGPLRSLDA